MTVNASMAAVAIHLARHGDDRLLIEHLRSGIASAEEQAFAADVVAGVWKQGRFDRAANATEKQKNIALAVLVTQKAKGCSLKEAIGLVQDVEGTKGNSRSSVHEALKNYRKEIESGAMFKALVRIGERRLHSRSPTKR
jgi:hypothetical protein